MRKQFNRRNLPPQQPMEVADEFIPSYKRAQELRPFLTGKGKIVPRELTTLSLKRQKLLVREIKRSRHLGLLPYVTVLK